MSENLRYVVTLDSETGKILKAEQLGEGGDLAEVDLAGFVRSIGSSLRVHHRGVGGGTGGAPVVINVYHGGGQGGTPEVAASHGQPPGTQGWDGPPPPPNKPGKP